MKIEKLKYNIKITNNGIFHDTRGDIRTLVKLYSSLADKVNEIIEKVNSLDTEKVTK